MKRMKLTCFAGLLLGVLIVTPAFAVSIGLDPFSESFTAGSAVDVDVYVTGLGSEIVSAYDLFISFDDTLLSFGGVDFGTDLGASSLKSWGSPVSGVAEIKETSLLSDAELSSLQPDMFVLATLNFTATSDGWSSFGFLTHADVTSLGEDVGVLDVIDVKGLRAEILPVDIVPEPSTLLLLGSGLAGLAGWRRRKA